MVLLWISIPDLHFIHRRHPPNFVWIRTARQPDRQTEIFFCLFCLLRHTKHKHSSKGENFLFTHAIIILSLFTYSVCDEKVKIMTKCQWYWVAPSKLILRATIQHSYLIQYFTFLRENLHLNINNNPNELTLRYGTTIDATFQKYLDTLESKSLFTYFSYHKAVVSFLEDSDVHPTIDNE